jgi:SAM-dependent methyltransferase
MQRNDEKKASTVVSFKSYSRSGIRYWVLSSLLSMTRTRLLNMINFPHSESLVVDLGCSLGYITRPLSLQAQTIGLDVDKDMVRWAKKFNKHIEFVCCDLCHLPLRNSSVDIAVCASVFEHIENLEMASKEIKFALKKRGKLFAGYPIETRIVDTIIKSFWKSESSTWDQHNVMKYGKELDNPHAHKRNYIDIRKILRKDFLPLKTQKIPKNYFPDFLSIYEVSASVRTD